MYKITRKTVNDILGLYLPMDIIMIIGAILSYGDNTKILMCVSAIAMLVYRLTMAFLFLLIFSILAITDTFHGGVSYLKPEPKLLLQIIFFSMIPVIVYPFITFIGIPYELPFIGLLSVLSTYKGFLIAYFFYENP